MTEHIKVYGVKPRIQYTANGTLNTYSFPFAIFKDADLCVYLNETKQDASAYFITGARSSDGGTVTFVTAPTAGTVITIIRVARKSKTNGGIIIKQTFNALDRNELDEQLLNSIGIRTVVQNYNSGNQWCRIWSDGLIEQGGHTESGIITTLLKPYSNTTYGVFVTPYADAADNTTASSNIKSRTTTTFVANNNYGYSMEWYAIGY